MTSSERISNLIRGKSIDRLPIVEWAPFWNITLDRWYKEGLSPELGYLELHQEFGLDPLLQTHFLNKSAATPLPKGEGLGLIKDRNDYLEIKKTLLLPPEKLVCKEHFDWLKKTRKEDDAAHFFTVEGFFWYPRTMFGIEPHLFSFYDEGDLLHEMCEDYIDWLEKVFTYAYNNYDFEFMSFAEDMSYNHGPMVSKDCFEEFLAPYYKRIIPMLKKYNIPCFIDSDGDITHAVDWYASVGADGMFPLERQAGVDVAKYIEKQPHMTFLGHFDKMCMKFGEDAMRKEFERLLPSAQKGKLIISCDHQTPPDVSLSNYRIYVKLFNEYARKVVK